MNDQKSKKSRRRVFVTGASGFLGSHVVDKLLKKGCDVVALVRRTSDTSRLIRSRVTLITGDIRDEAVLSEALKDVDSVVHAAVTVVGSWENHYAVNVEATKSLLALSCSANIKKFVYISSISVYLFSTMRKKQVYTEDTPFEKEQLNNYSRSKIEAEKLVWEYRKRYGLPCSVLRPGAIYGPGGPIFPAMTGLAFSESRIVLIGSGRRALPLSYVENVADAVWLCLEKGHTDGGCYNLVEDKTLTRIEYVKLLRKRVNPRLSIVKLPYLLAVFLKFFLKTTFGLMGRKAPLSALNLKTYRDEFSFSTERAKKELRKDPYVGFAESIDRTMTWNREKRIPKRSGGMEHHRVIIPSEDQLRVGVVGCGGIAEVHLSTLQRMRNARLVALADLNRETRDLMAKRFRVEKTYPDIHQMLEREKLDVVHVLTPPQTHAEIALAAMNRKCHVLIEKPMATDAEEARRMIRAAERNRVKLCVDHNVLYDEVMIKAREILAAGQIGRVVYVESWYGLEFNPYSPLGEKNHWVYGLPGALYQDYLIHPLYLLMDVMEEVTRVRVSSKYVRVVPHMETDELRVVIEDQERFGILCLSTGVSPRYSFLNVYGTSGTLKIDFLNKYVFLDKSMSMLPKAISRVMMTLKQTKVLGCASFKNFVRLLSGRFSLTTGADRLIRLFYRSILLDEPVPVSGEEGVRSMEIMDAIWEQLTARSTKQ